MADIEKITFETEDGSEDFYIIDETRINEVDYILVTDSDDPEAEEVDVMILKDVSAEGDEEAVFEVVTDEKELAAVIPLFEDAMGDVDIS